MAVSSTPGTEPPPLTLRDMLRMFGLAIAVGIGLGLFGFFATLFAGWFITGYARQRSSRSPHERTPGSGNCRRRLGL